MGASYYYLAIAISQTKVSVSLNYLMTATIASAKSIL